MGHSKNQNSGSACGGNDQQVITVWQIIANEKYHRYRDHAARSSYDQFFQIDSLLLQTKPLQQTMRC